MTQAVEGNNTQCFQILYQHATSFERFLGTLLHFISCRTRKCHTQNGFWHNALVSNQAHQALHKNRSFTGTSRSDEGSWPTGMGDSCCLLRISGKFFLCRYLSFCLVSGSL